jgi:hypothetical protein
MPYNLHEDLYTFLSHLAQFFLERDKFQTEVVENPKIHILCSIFSLENRAIYGIIWKTTVESDRPQMTIWRMRIV